MFSINQIIQELITLWVVIDPIGTLPVFIAMTVGLSPTARREVAIKSTAVAFGVRLVFILAGQIVLEALGLSLGSFQIAGGLVLLLFSLSMIFGESKPETELRDARSNSERAIFPLAIPSIASPGAMLAVVILTDNDRFSIAHQTMTSAVMAFVLLCTFGIMLLATPIYKVIGLAGASIISRVMGMILAAVAIDAMLNGLVRVGVIAPF